MKFLFFLFPIFLSCSYSIKESIIDLDNHEIVAGFSKKAALQIGQPFTCTQETQAAGIKKGLVPQCIKITGKPSKIQLIYVANPKYSTSKGVSSGDSVNKVIKIYGKPKATYLDYGILDNSFHSEYKGLFYENLTFFLDSAFTRVSSICLGSPFPLEKKYIKK